MKFLLIVLLFTTLQASAQTDTLKTTKDTTKNFVVFLNEKEFAYIIAFIRDADRKPSEIAALLEFLNARTQQIQPPSKKK